MKYSHNPITRQTALLHRHTHVYFDRQLRPYGLTFTHMRMLGFLAHHEGIRQEEIRAFIGADKGGVAHSIKRLVEKGYVVRDKDPNDGRAYVINLTDEGRELLSKLAEIAGEWDKQMIAGLSNEEKKLAEGLLKRMADNACALIEEDCEGRHGCSKEQD